MEALPDLASKAAEPFLQQGILGALCVALAVALVGAVVVMRRDTNAERAKYDAEIALKDKKIDDLHTSRLEDTKTALGSVTAAVKTVEATINALNSLGRK